jgi:peptidyl-prolyl cis-trans isomerase C
LSAGLRGQAIEQYRLYLSESTLPDPRRANLAYTLGKLYMEEGQYEEALAWLYQVEMLDPRTDLAPEVGSKIVACLERLGRYAQAQYSLEARSSMDRGQGDEFKGDRVVAQIGKEVITLKELDEAVDAMPEWMRGSLEDPQQREAFLKQYVAEELLYRKAKRLEMDKDPGVRKQADRALRQLMVQRVLENEIKDKVRVSAEDVGLYYRANKDRYQEKEAFKIRLIQVDEMRLDDLLRALKDGQPFAELAKRYSVHEDTRESGGEVAEWIEEGLDPTGMGDPGKLWQALSNHTEGEVAGPIKTEDGCYLFQILSHRSPRTPDLEEVKKRVESDLYQQRVEKAYQELVRQSLEASDVKLFPEAIRRDEETNSETATHPG